MERRGKRRQKNKSDKRWRRVSREGGRENVIKEGVGGSKRNGRKERNRKRRKRRVKGVPGRASRERYRGAKLRLAKMDDVGGI